MKKHISINRIYEKGLIMAYTPELNQSQSAVLRRIAWACKKPMTKTMSDILDHLVATLDKNKICDACKDKSACEHCTFLPGTSFQNPESIISTLTKKKHWRSHSEKAGINSF